MNPQVHMVGFEEFAQALGIASDTVQATFEKAAMATAVAIRTGAQQKVPKRSFVLMNSIIAEAIPGGAMTEVHEIYGTYVEFGTGLFGPLHRRITPKSGKVLAWMGPEGMLFARSTKGMKAQPFFNPAIDENMVTLAEQLKVGLETVVSELATGK